MRRPSSLTALIAGVILSILLISFWAKRQAWFPATAYLHEPSAAHSYKAPSTSLGATDSAVSPDPDLTRDIYNSTLGFEKIFVVSLPSRTDRRDSIILAAALSNIEFEFIDGVDGSLIPDTVIPSGPKQGRLPDAPLGCWRAHMNAIQETVRRNLGSVLILEDDVDWDVRIRDQLRDFALSSRALTQPLASTPKSYADKTFPRPSDNSPVAVPDIHLNDLPATIAPQKSPYGDNWDLFWLGHCGMHFPFTESKAIPKGRVVYTEETVPQTQHLWTLSDPNDIKEQYPNHTRVVHHAQDGICSGGYAVTQKSARNVLYELGLKDMNAAYDILLRWFCENGGEPSRGHHHCLTVQPPLFGIHLPAQPKSHNSDISDHGEGFQEKKTENVRYSVKMNIQALLKGGTDLVDQFPDVD
ncbi:Uu.00g084420.m01.CDS01 [Anthostomella pinea]|uniref:Uu.00g084420.m01.CDS01 n=1 Tax=Anthostomella pinea TaxID=933095 RepID=A0AAI8VMP2_9PEZI|nr:Uu.00g084420.m01.CDS01 [Anthostomella pinea]